MDDFNISPMLDPNMSSARSTTSTSTGPAAKPYISKVGVLPSSLPAYHKVFMERERAKAAGEEIADTSLTAIDPLPQPRSQAEQEETLRRLKPHSRSQLRLDEANKRPQGLTPVNPPKKSKPIRWQFGIRSRNAPWEALVCIYKALSKLGASWLVDEDYDKVHGNDEDDPDYNGSPRSRKPNAPSPTDPTKKYKLPADPWKIKIRWTTETLKKHSVATGTNEFGDYVSRDAGGEIQIVAMRMDIQIYEMDQGVYLVDFKVDGYETPEGKLMEEKEVTSPFPFLDMAARLIMQLADAD